MSDFDLQSVLAQIMRDDDELEATHVVETMDETCAQGSKMGGRTEGERTAKAEKDLNTSLPGDAVLMTAPAVTTLVTGEDDAMAYETTTSAGAVDTPEVALAESAVDAVPLTLNYPTFTEENLAETMDVRNYATLCKLKVRKWGGRVKDKKAAKQSAREAGAVDGAYSTYKRLFAGVEDRLRAVNTVLDAARTRHYEMTLPWSVTGSDDRGRRDGPRLLANTLFMEYITEMGAAKQQTQQVLGELERAYPSMIVDAKRNLGNGFDIKQYPTSSDIKDYFDLEFEFMPVPAGADYKGLPGQQVTALANKLNKSMQQCMENACRDIWQRTYTKVEKMKERLGDPKHIFHDTLVSNIRELAALLEHLNPTKDPRIENIRSQIQNNLCRFEPEDLRKDLSKRALTAKLAGEVLEEMERTK